MRVWIIDQARYKVIDIIPHSVWQEWSYEDMCKAYSINEMDWVLETYEDYRDILDNYKEVL